MKKLILLCLLVPFSVYPQNRIGKTEIETSRGGHTAKVIFDVGKFEPLKHTIIGLDPCDDYRSVRIDGQYPLGTDCTLPIYDIQEMVLIFDGIKVEIPPKLYSNCYHPPFPRSDNSISDYLAIKIGDDLHSIFIFMDGGDAAGQYQVIWVLRPDGKHSKFTTGPCPDCSFIKFDSGFDDRN